MDPLEPRFHTIDRSSEPLLANLYELYLYDMAPWFGFDLDPSGSYIRGTDRLERYWHDGFTVHVALVGEAPAGFAIVGRPDRWVAGRSGHDLAEFFVVRKYRRRGLGERMARHLWSTYPGDWLVRVARRNEPALPFWRSIIAAFTDGDFSEDPAEAFDMAWSYFTFTSG